MTILQRNENWHADRCGKVTASRIKDIAANPAKGRLHNALTLTILAERLTGVQEESKITGPMQWGIDQEPYAIAAYENETGNFVCETGFIDHPDISNSGASPDGLVGSDGQIEVKCPSTTTHINTLLSRKVPDEHIPQITWQLACTRRVWCDFISYDPCLPKHLQIVIIRVFAKDLDIAGIECSVTQFNKTVEAVLKEMSLVEVAA
ncbi:lambda exonuclease family protein [Acinetobacter indicus]|uniref:lambda exonuclease family protein n=1 Tax=Acinetobacter indicus TaxID=756892 RepID=UPI000FD90595|nr:lambda exonuclease family protein [Acinetobacter indicus]RVT36873.1 exonuclease [Acinetobacter indicus]